MVKNSVLLQICVAAVTLALSAPALGQEEVEDFAVDAEGPLTARDFWANRGKKSYSYVRPNSMMNTYTKKEGKRGGSVLRPNSLLNTYAKRVLVMRPNSMLTTYSVPPGKRGTLLRPNSLLNTYQGKRAFRPNSILNSYKVDKRGLNLRPNSLLNTYQGKRSFAFRPNSILNVYKGRGLRSLRPNSFLNVYDTAKPKRSNDPDMMTPPFDSEDEGDADEQFVEGNQLLLKGDEDDEETDDEERNGVEEVFGPRMYREFWSSRGKRDGENFFAVRG